MNISKNQIKVEKDYSQTVFNYDYDKKGRIVQIQRKDNVLNYSEFIIQNERNEQKVAKQKILDERKKNKKPNFVSVDLTKSIYLTSDKNIIDNPKHKINRWNKNSFWNLVGQIIFGYAISKVIVIMICIFASIIFVSLYFLLFTPLLPFLIIGIIFIVISLGLLGYIFYLSR